MGISECSLFLPFSGETVQIKFNSNKAGSYCGVHAIVDTDKDRNDPEPIFNELQKNINDGCVSIGTQSLNVQCLTQRMSDSHKERKAIERVLSMLRTKELSHPRRMVLCRDSDLQLKIWALPKVISVIEDAFPDMQLIILTANPYILSVLPKERVYIYDSVKGFTNPSWQTRGSDIDMILWEILDADDVPDTIERKWVNEYSGLAAQELYDTEEAKALLKKIVEHFGTTHYMTYQAASAAAFAKTKQRIFKRKGE